MYEKNACDIINKNKWKENIMSEYESLKEKLFNNKKCGWESLSEEEKQKINL